MNARGEQLPRTKRTALGPGASCPPQPSSRHWTEGRAWADSETVAAPHDGAAQPAVLVQLLIHTLEGFEDGDPGLVCGRRPTAQAEPQRDGAQERQTER